MTAAPDRSDRDSDCQKNHCHGKRRQAPGEVCHRPAGWGTDHPGIGRCKLHGGGTQSHKTAAKTEMARQAVATYGLPREVAPEVALLEEVHRTAGHVAWLGELLGSDREPLTQRGEFGPTTSVWVDLYQRERTHLARVAKDALAAGIAERQVRLAERQGALLAGAVNRILDALELTPKQRELVSVVVPRELRAITGGAE